jgi:predicted nucleic acid-binding protein
VNVLHDVILDASVGIAIVRNEQGSDAATRSIERWLAEGRRMLVPSLFWLEVSNALFRRHGWRGEQVLNAVHELEELGIETVEPGASSRLFVIDLAERFRLSAYDAQYLATAEELDAGLATFDAGLALAAGRRLVPMGDDGRLSEAPAGHEAEVTWPRYREVASVLARLRASTEADVAARAMPGRR